VSRQPDNLRAARAAVQWTLAGVLLWALVFVLTAPAHAVEAIARPTDGDIGAVMFLQDPPAAPLAASGRANPCRVVNLVEGNHFDFGDGPQATWVFRLSCRRNPSGRPLTLRFVRPGRTCTARGWGYPSASSTDVEVIAERCRYVGVPSQASRP
jgi:hypothetical protein